MLHEVVGQEAIKQRMLRSVQQNRVPHAQLILGNVASPGGTTPRPPHACAGGGHGHPKSTWARAGLKPIGVEHP